MKALTKKQSLAFKREIARIRRDNVREFQGPFSDLIAVAADLRDAQHRIDRLNGELGPDTTTITALYTAIEGVPVALMFGAEPKNTIACAMELLTYMEALVADNLAKAGGKVRR